MFGDDVGNRSEGPGAGDNWEIVKEWLFLWPSRRVTFWGDEGVGRFLLVGAYTRKSLPLSTWGGGKNGVNSGRRFQGRGLKNVQGIVKKRKVPMRRMVQKDLEDSRLVAKRKKKSSGVAGRNGEPACHRIKTGAGPYGENLQGRQKNMRRK